MLLLRCLLCLYNRRMYQIDDAIVNAGKLVLSDLPFSEGQHVRIFVAEIDERPAKPASIGEVRRLLKGGVERFEDPFEPLIPLDNWEMLK